MNFWAFYRLRKLRKYLLYVIMPSIVALLVVIGVQPIYDSMILALDFKLLALSYLSYHAVIVGQLLDIGLQGFTIYLVITWSRKHNRKYDLE